MRAAVLMMVAGLTALGVRGAAELAPPPDSSMRIDASQVVNRVSPWMYGSCIEDVNHEIYGGLYAQMLFGESFEEPAAALPVRGWSAYGGSWRPESGELRVGSMAGGKLVRQDPEFADGEAEVEVRVEQPGDNAGLITRVRNPRTGPDTWSGYEISISPLNHAVILGRHNDNWELLRSQPAPVAYGHWHKLRVRMEGARLRVFLDGSAAPVIDFTDPNPLLSPGRVGVRTWNSDAAYRNLRFHSAGSPEVADSFSPAETPGGAQEVSGMWDTVRTGSARGSLRLDHDRPFNTAQSQRIELTAGPGTLGVANRGLNHWGLTFRKGHRYSGRVYLRGAAGARVTVALENGDGSHNYASRKLGAVSADWKRFDFNLEPDQTETKGRFAISLDQPGTVWVDQAYLSPTGDELFSGGTARADITKALQAQGLTLLRYGGSMVNAPAYRWKQMVGDPDRRPQYLGMWYPQSTNGWAIPEFAAFCRAAGFEPVIAINIDDTDQDASDLIEFMNGPATSPWGRRRAEMGYPEPFNVRYWEIGNEEGLGGSPEQYRPHYLHYLERFHALHRSMLRRDPDLKLIIAAWWRPEDPVIRRIVEETRDEAPLWDLHVGGDGLRDGEEVDRLFTQMRRLVQEWAPGTKLKACVLEENGGLHNLRRALGHAAILNATQRHGDFVLMDCPANCLQPWLQNDNGWDQGQIFFTSSQVWGMPPFYAQQMAAHNHLPERLSSEVACPNRELDLTATRSEDAKTIVLKVVNIGSRAHRASVRIENGRPLSNRAEVTTLSGQLDDRNSPQDPERIRSVKSDFHEAGREFEYTFPAYAYTVIRLRAR